ncbi:hypothetical protein ACFX2I_010176 [Malus domestica]|uniref:F-box/LRR-repeat protein At4g14103-like n=1 Tax=Malus domestica TaxID=3750 RepID=UPI003975DE2B
MSKRAAAASCEGLGVYTECTADRLSNLPEGVAHNILSLVTFRDLTRFGSLSKRCRELYLSTPGLNFSLWQFDVSTCDEWSRFSDSVDRFFTLRGDSNIHHLHIGMRVFNHRCETPSICADKECRIIPWIKNVVRCNVELLDLHMILPDVKKPFEFPSCIFLCGSLRTLLVRILHGTIKAPSLACLSNLECLNLKYVTLGQDFFNWISSCCKCIKELNLDRVCGERDITIESTSLKSFSIVTSEDRLHQLKISGEKLEDIHIEWSSKWCWSLSIFASNLKYLEWPGNTVVNDQLGILEKAEISFAPQAYEAEGKAFDLLCSIQRVKALTLDQNTIMDLFKEGHVSVPPLDDVSDFRINIGSFSDKLVLPLVSLLRVMPNLSILYLASTPSCFSYRKNDCSGFNTKYWKSQNLPFVSQLKEVTVELSQFSYGSNPVEFTRFILEHARNLKKMVIVHPPRFAKASLDKLKKSEKTSNAHIVFCRNKY